MGNDIQPINYEAVLADLEARKAKLETMIAGVREFLGQTATSPSGGPGGGISPAGKPAHDAFIGMSIPEAAKKHLSAVRRKLPTQELMNALTEGGLPESKYSTVYAILRRRERQVGDIINMKGDWALSEWYPNYRKRTKAEGEETDAESGAENDSTVSEDERQRVNKVTEEIKEAQSKAS
jgi:hypothetical protein